VIVNGKQNHKSFAEKAKVLISNSWTDIHKRVIEENNRKWCICNTM